MRKNYRYVCISILICYAIVFTGGCQTGPVYSNALIFDDFSSLSDSWQLLNASGKNTGRYEISNGQLHVFANEPVQGVYHNTRIGGHFIAEAEFAADKNVGL